MAWTRYQIGLAVLLIVTGSINTISSKWADEMESENSEGVKSKFVHPFLQALAMFLGEVLCLITFNVLFFNFRRRKSGLEDNHGLTKGKRDFNRFILLLPAMCDMASSSVTYIGLNLTYASSYQMFVGSVIIFVGLLSVIFLGRRLKLTEWFGMLLVIVGLMLVGLSDFLFPDDQNVSYPLENVITGDILIIIGQILTSIQMVIEEKYVSGLDIPALQAVGWEGLFGFTVLGLLQIPFYFIYVGAPFAQNPRGVLEDVPDGFTQIANNPLLILALLGNVFSIAFFNFAGISVTKEMSATTRMMIDSSRTLIIWIFSLTVFGQKFQVLQLIGFIVLISGMCTYNGINIGYPFVWAWRKLTGNVDYIDDYNNYIEENTGENIPGERIEKADIKNNASTTMTVNNEKF